MTVAFVWNGLVVPALTNWQFTDFLIYIRTARWLGQGMDPYRAFRSTSFQDSVFAQTYIYQPLLAWLLQPLVPLGEQPASWVFEGLLLVALVGFALAVFRALGVRSRDEVLLAVILVMAYLPVRRDLFVGQVNLLLLMLSGLFLLAWVRGDRWWGGVALGVGSALKVIQAPLGLLLIWGGRWRILAAAVGTGTVLTLAAAPQYLPEYFLRVLPRIGHASGFRENSSPSAFIARLLYPQSFFGGAPPGGNLVLVLGLAVGVAALLATWHALGRRPRQDVPGRALEVAAAVATIPLLQAVNYHQSLEMLPILVLVIIGVRRRDPWMLAAAAAGWLLPGPLHAKGIGEALPTEFLFRVWNELQLLGIVLLWLGCLRALRQAQSAEHHLQEPALE